MHSLPALPRWLTLAALVLLFADRLCADEPASSAAAPRSHPADAAAAADTGAADAATAEAEQLHILEQALLNDYQRFEEKLLELAEYTRSNDPDRAELLIRTRSESTARRVQAQMKRIAEALTPTEAGDVLYGDALSRQDELIADLADLLKLLQSEDERDRIDREIARLQGLLKDTDRLIGQQKDVRADTERGGDSDQLTDDQRRVAEQAEKLAGKIDRQDAERRAESDNRASPKDGDPSGESPEGEMPEGEQTSDPSAKPPGDRDSDKSDNGESPDGEQGTDKPADGKPKPTDDPAGDKSDRPAGKPSKEGDMPKDSAEEKEPPEGQPSSGGKSSDSEKPDGKPPKSSGTPSQQPAQPPPGESGEQESSQGQPSASEQTPGREQLDEARQRMEQAIEELELKRLDQASDEQDAALAELEEMKAQLEEILRQLREEEKRLFLMALEARFQRMLEQQLDINNGTLKLDRVAAAERDDNRHLAQTTQLSRDQGENVTEAEKALMLLHEDGSSVAFPEAVEMMRDNMQAVVGRLQRGDVGETTQVLERMIVESLEEIVFALQREIEKQEEEQQQQQQQQGEPTDPQLVDVLAELKMVRSLQSQVNRLTRQYGLELEGEQATDPEDLSFLRNLAARQRRIQEATYDLSIGKNR